MTIDTFDQNHQGKRGVIYYTDLINRDPNNLDALINLGVHYMNTENVKDGLLLLQNAEKIDDQNYTVKTNIGLAYFYLSHYEDAVRYFRACSRLQPEDQNVYVNLGNAYAGLRDFDLATESYNRALKLNPENVQAHNNLANLALERQDFQTAINYFRKVLLLDASFTVAHLNLCIALKADQQYEAALTELTQLEATEENLLVLVSHRVECYIGLHRLSEALTLAEETLANHPKDRALQQLLAHIYFRQERYQEAKVLQTRLVESYPDHIDSYLDLATLNKKLGLLEDALENYKQALRLEPTSYDIYVNMGSVLHRQGQSEAAKICYEIAIALNADSPVAYNNIGGMYMELQQYQHAEHFLKKALEYSPGDADILSNLGLIYRKLATRDLAVSCFEESVRPLLEQYHTQRGQDKITLFYTVGQTQAVSFLVQEYRFLCAWDQADTYLPIVENILDEQLISEGILGITPFTSQFLVDTKRYQLPIAQSYAQQKSCAPTAVFSHNKSRLAGKKKLTIGYVSPDFHTHVVGFLINDLFRYHNRQQFKVHTYMLQEREDEQTRIIQECSDHYRNVHKLGYADIAHLIHEDGVDILIDLAGHTGNNRLEVFSYCPAPVQAHFFGQTGTMGAEYIPYHIHSAFGAPIEDHSYYSEYLVHLPDAPFALNKHSLPETLPTRADYALPEDKFVYCCFNNAYRIDRDVFQIWMNILKQTPESVLWLSAKEPEVEQQLRRAAEQQGIQAERLIFRPYMMLNDDWHIHLADLYLDTLVISGGTTSMLALWAGTPVATCVGSTPQARYGAAVVDSLQIPELICQNIGEYIAFALKCYQDRTFLAHLKQRVLEQAAQSTLYNQQRFMQHFEQACWAMWHHCMNDSQDKVITF